MKWARIKDENNDVEVTDTDPAGRYVPEIEAEFFQCNDAVTPNSVFHGGDAMNLANWTIWIPPPPPPENPALPTVGPGRMYQLVPLQTRIDIKNSNDPIVKEIYDSLQVAMQTSEPIDLGSISVQQELGYLVATDVSPTPQSGARKYLTQAQMDKILTNTLP
jgi:hypothetical protein